MKFEPREVLENVRFVHENSRFVRIDEEKATSFAATFKVEHIARWLSVSPVDLSKLSIEDRLSFLFVFDSISFSYWGDPKWTVNYREKDYDGSWAMVTSSSGTLVGLARN